MRKRNEQTRKEFSVLRRVAYELVKPMVKNFIKGAVGGLDGKIELLSTVTLGSKGKLFLISCDGSRFLIGSGSDGVTCVVHTSFQHESTIPTGVSA